jgi:penicillin-binding protein 2
MLTVESHERRRNDEHRLVGLRVFFVVCFVLMAVFFWRLQIVQHEKYEEMAANNHLKTVPLRAPRGVVFDRHGRVLVENRYSFTIAIVREQLKDIEATVQRLAQVTGTDEARIREAISRRLREPVFRPLPVIEHATFEQVAAVTARRHEMPEILVQQVPTRTYPAEGLAAHAFGYVGEVQEAQLASAEFSRVPLQPGAIIGQTGLERFYNDSLMGTDGNRFVVVNSIGRELDVMRTEHPIDGARMQVTLDYDVQKSLEDAFAHAGVAGAGVILDPSTGELLAATSLPAFDPNAFAVGIAGAEWSKLLNDPLRPMTNRILQGTYPPGSTFKIVMAVAALEEGIVTPETTFFCPGHGTFYGRSFQCNRPGGHGTVDVRTALAQSCNVYFYNLGQRMDIDTIHRYSAALGLVGKTGIDLPNEGDSFVASTAWKQRTQKEPWYPGETISVSIGQGAVAVTPLALATMVATVANGGTLVTPQLARAFDNGDGRGWQPLARPDPRSRLAIDPANLQAVRDGLWMVVNGTGTGRAAQIEGRDVSGKTGTAQANVSLRNRAAAAGRGVDVRDHRWFVFFAPRDNPQVAGVIFAEHGGATGSATPIAKHVLETFFAKRDGLPLPVLPGRTAPGGPQPVLPAAVATPASATPAVTAPAARRLATALPLAGAAR